MLKGKVFYCTYERKNSQRYGSRRRGNREREKKDWALPADWTWWPGLSDTRGDTSRGQRVGR